MVHKIFLGLDVGERRIGLAVGDSEMRLAWPRGVADVNGTEADQLKARIKDESITDIVLGRPRNQSGTPTAQTEFVEKFAETIVKPLGLPIHWQDESVTSVIAEERLKARTKTYTKADIDAEAAAILLQDFLEAL